MNPFNIYLDKICPEGYREMSKYVFFYILDQNKYVEGVLAPGFCFLMISRIQGVKSGDRISVV